MSRHRHVGLVCAASAFVLLGSWAGGALGLLVLPVALTVPGYLAVASVPDRHGVARFTGWLAVPVSLAMIVVLSLVSRLVFGSYRAWAVAGLLAGCAIVLGRRLDRAAVALPRVDRRLVVAGLAVTVLGAAAFALTAIGSVIPDEPYLQVRFTSSAAPLGGAEGRVIGIDIVNHTAERSEVVVEAKWGGWLSGPATRVVPPAGTMTSTIRLPAAVPCRGTIEVIVTSAGGHSSRMLTREVRPGDC
ncbi:hypothetical protein DMB66_40360 [Actinoplanes sp. ATCC 53533]|uniref:hypothetical protein n=1 Tax=Actinoplanes sp. ATCC 53533 TaxID=1288362 RepID=UPI000F7B92F7|nr:hypothetical protein [Actinoplanes sp. ATCC 53533]RSM52174.1 hypothetical protein DMB66_40360 [Actinoplanes sp. ATCC 53533]